MANLTGFQRLASLFTVTVVGLAACEPLVVDSTADRTVDNNPVTLVEDVPSTGVDGQSDVISLSPSAPITGSLGIELAQVSTVSGAEVTEPYVPDNYSVYAQARGLDIPSNLSQEVDAQFRAFYNYIFNQQFEITNADGTVTIGSLLNASNPELAILIARDGTLYLEGAALDNDPAFGNGDHYFIMIWDSVTGTIISLKSSKDAGKPWINGFGDYTIQVDGFEYYYNKITNRWELSPALPPTGTATPMPPAAPATVVASTTPTSVPPEATTERVYTEIEYDVPGVEGPVYASLLVHQTDPAAETRLAEFLESSVHAITVDYHETFTTVSVYPAFIKGFEIFKAKTTIGGNEIETRFAYVEIVYMNDRGEIETAIVIVWDGFSTNSGNQKLDVLRSLIGDSVAVVTATDLLVNYTPEQAFYDGGPRAQIPLEFTIDDFKNGGGIVVSGYTYNIRRWVP